MEAGKLNALVGDIYESVLEPALWPSILERIADSVNATTTAFSMHDPTTRYGLVLGHVRADPSMRQMYDDYYHKLNPHIQHLSQTLRIGELAVGQMAISDQALERTEYYNDFLKRQDLFHLAGGTIARDGSLVYGLTTLRSRRNGEFKLQELKPLEAIFPHLARAARISRELNTSAQVVQSFVTLQIGLILLDRRGRVLQANTPAERILNQNDGLSLSAQGELLSQKRNEALPAKISAAIATALGRGLHSGGDVLIERPSAKTPYRLSIMPLRISNFVSEWKQAVAAIFVTDSEPDAILDGKLLHQHFGVTKREAAVAALLVQGLDLNEICAQLGVKKTTVRTQIRSLMDKFAVKRQAALVLKLSKLGASRFSGDGTLGGQ